MDQQAGTVSAFISHFSSYAVIAPLRQPTAFSWLPYGAGGVGATLLASLLLLAYMRRWHIAIVLPTGTLVAGSTPQPIHLGAKNAKMKPMRLGQNVSVKLRSTSLTARFDVSPDGPFDGSVNKAVISKETGEVTVYYKDATPGRQTLRARTEYKLAKWTSSRPPAWSKSQLDVLPPDSPPQP